MREHRSFLLFFAVLSLMLAWITTAEWRAMDAQEEALMHKEIADSLAVLAAEGDGKIQALEVELATMDSVFRADSARSAERMREQRRLLSDAENRAARHAEDLERTLSVDQAVILDSILAAEADGRAALTASLEEATNIADALRVQRDTQRLLVTELRLQVSTQDREIAALRASLDESFRAVAALETAKRRQGWTLTALGAAAVGASILLR